MNLTGKIYEYLENIKESDWYKDLYDKEPSFVPLEEIYNELVKSSKYRKFKLGTNSFGLTDKNASWHQMFGASRNKDERIIEWSTPKWSKSFRYGNYKVYLGFKDITVPVEDLNSQVRLEVVDGEGKDYGTNSFMVYPTDKDSIQSVTNKLFERVLKFVESVVKGG